MVVVMGDKRVCLASYIRQIMPAVQLVHFASSQFICILDIICLESYEFE